MQEVRLWRAALCPLSVDGMIVGASMTLLSDARHGRKGGPLPWALLIIGSGASLAADVAVKLHGSCWSGANTMRRLRTSGADPAHSRRGQVQAVAAEDHTGLRLVGGHQINQRLYQSTGRERGT